MEKCFCVLYKFLLTKHVARSCCQLCCIITACVNQNMQIMSIQPLEKQADITSMLRINYLNWVSLI